MSGSDRFSSDLPWGWWLRMDATGVEDEQGRKWKSVRDAFWRGHLGFPDHHVAPEQHELLLRMLSGIHANWQGVRELSFELFEGNMLLWRFYQCWLASIGMLTVTEWRGALEAPLSAEGRAVMLMLQATRDPQWVDLPLSAVMDAVAAATRSSEHDARERALQMFERHVGIRRHTFARETMGRAYLVTLTGVGVGARMPTRRVTWSQRFADQDARDDLFAWVAQRVDRWDAWGQLAYQRGADAFTAHLLSVVIGSGGLKV